MAVDVLSFWKGHLRLALVTIPIRLVSAPEPGTGIRLHQADRNSHQRMRYLKVAAGSGEPAGNADIAEGVEVDPGRYVLLQEDELGGLQLDTRHTVGLPSFVKMTDLDPVFYDSPCYVLPDGDIAKEGYRVIADAPERVGVAGIGQLMIRGPEHLVALSPGAGGLMLATPRYESGIRDPARNFSGIGEGNLLRRSLGGGGEAKVKGTGLKGDRSRAVASAAKREATKRGKSDAPEVKAKPSDRRNRSGR